MRVVSWNVNSIRARLDLILALIEQESPDVIALQETKCSDLAFPGARFSELGYTIAHVGNGPLAGVCLLSRRGLQDIQYGFGGTPTAPFDEPRLLAATIGGLRIITAYAPNGKRVGTSQWQMKLAWFELLRTELELELEACRRRGRALLVVGDLNVCPTLDDVYDPIKKRHRNLVSTPERDAFARLTDLGFVDVARSLHGPDAGYTWFSFNGDQFAEDRGYRLDVALASNSCAELVTRCEVVRRWRDPQIVERPSDHAPLLVELAPSLLGS